MMDRQLLAAYADPRFRAVLGVIRDAEGTSKYSDPYRVAGGGKSTLSQLDTPTFQMWGFTDKTGKTNQSSATGAYQFLGKTWDGLAKKHGFTDFSPRTQDLAALALIKDAGGFPYIQRGDYLGALNQVRKIWASLPGAGYNQQERGRDFLVKSLEKHLSAPVNEYFDQNPVQEDNSIITNNPDTEADPYAKMFNINTPENGYIGPQRTGIMVDSGQLAPQQVVDFTTVLWE